MEPQVFLTSMDIKTAHAGWAGGPFLNMSGLTLETPPSAFRDCLRLTPICLSRFVDHTAKLGLSTLAHRNSDPEALVLLSKGDKHMGEVAKGGNRELSGVQQALGSWKGPVRKAG